MSNNDLVEICSQYPISLFSTGGEREMELVQVGNNGVKQDSSYDALSFARSYQLEALEKAIKQNTIVFLETGSGKTLIAIMLLHRYTHILQKPSPFIAVFLVPTVVLVSQQAEAVKMHTDLKVGKYWGEMGVDYWDEGTWKQQQFEYEVLVMTPAILLDALRHSFLKMELIKVLIFDECHHARGKHPYACIMTEFYHKQLKSSNSQLPRIFGMTASPVKSKGSTSGSYWSQIHKLETLMNSKVYTCTSESVLAKYIPFSATMLKFYEHKAIPYALFQSLENDLERMMEKHMSSLRNSNLSELAMESAKKRLSKLYGDFCFCLSELGVWLALKAAEFLSCEGTDTFSWGKLDVCSETICRDFTLDARKIIANHIPSEWSICHDEDTNVDAGYLTTKVMCLIESLSEYRHLEDLRCIIFVERVITAIVLKQLLCELYPKLIGWKTEYTAGNNSAVQPQSRQSQNKIVEDFRKGKVNIIVATSILEEGLDVQSCNLVIRFDLSATICSFIQSRGRARMQNSHFLLLVRSGDHATISRVKRYIASGDVMREESLRNASFPCAALDSELCEELHYRVETTGAIVTLSSSVSLIYFYCSRLPSDGYFKPSPRCVVDKELETCTVYFPKSFPIPNVTVASNNKMLKQVACLEACRQLHLIGALTDHLVPDIVVEEADAQHIGYEYVEEQVKYFPSELVSRCENNSDKDYHCYLIELQRMFDYDIHLNDIVLAVSTKIEFDDSNLNFSLEADRGVINVCIRYVGDVHLSFEEVLLCQRFQFTLCRVLLDHNLVKLKEVLDAFQSKNDFPVFDYLLLPSVGLHKKPGIDWKCVVSVLFPYNNKQDNQANCSVSKRHHRVNTKNSSICSCLVEHSLVCTPHNGKLYCITSALHDLNGNSLLTLKDGEEVTYKNYYRKRHGIDLQFEKQPLFSGRQVFPVRNCLLDSRQFKEKEPSNATVELPPELFFIIMSPISIETFYSFSFMPSIMHRIESWLIAANLKKMLVDHCTLNVGIPTTKVLEAITTKKCQEKFHLESLETLGDSFLKYASSQHLFKTHQNQHEGILSTRREKIISNATLCKLGCDRNLPGFIRNEPFDPKTWSVPGDLSGKFALTEEFLSGKTKIYSAGTRDMKSKVVADAVEALIGAYLSNGGEAAALSFMDWLGIKVDLTCIPYVRDFAVDPVKLLNIRHLENLFNYKFCDPSLLVEALTHGSYMLPEIPKCYQRLEFLGDAVLDYLITVHLYHKHPGISPGMLTDLRSASVNNDCYALSALKIGLHKHILHCSQELHMHISATLNDFEKLLSESTFGWESETAFPKVLGDVIESIAGAIYVDSGYNKEIVFQSIRPILEPLITPETIRFHPVKELNELCQKLHYVLQKTVDVDNDGVKSVVVTVEANGAIFKETRTAADKKMAEKLATKAVLKALKETLDNPNSRYM